MNSKQPTPPSWILRWFRWFCKPELHPYLEGDLLEHFQLLAEDAGRSKARNKMVLDVIRLMRPGIVRSFIPTQKLNTIMLKHTFKIAIRNFTRYKATFLINLTGLASGLTAVLFIMLWVQDELKMDQFHKNKDQLYQVMMNFDNPDGVETIDWTPAPLAAGLKSEIPQILATTHAFSPETKGVLSWNEGSEIRANEIYVDPDFFKLFSFELISGTPETVLRDRKSVVISEQMALAIFNRTTNVIGEILNFKQEALSGDYVVSGVFKDISSYSTQQFAAAFSTENLLAKFPDFNAWNYNDPLTYLLVDAQADIAALNGEITTYLKSKPNVSVDSVFLRSYSGRYLYGQYENGVQAGGRVTYIRLFTTIAGLILLIACVNFMNLSTAQAARRIKEVGIKKAIGSQKSSLIYQFLGESLLLSTIALAVSLVLVVLLLPAFNSLVDKFITLSWAPRQLLMLLGIALVTGLVSGSYPAFYLSGFSPVQLLKGKLNRSNEQTWLRKGMVVFQFSISVVLITAIAAAYKQVELIHNKNLGYEREQVLSFAAEGKVGQNLDTYMNEVRNIPGVLDATNFNYSLFENSTGTTGVVWDGKHPDDQTSFKYIMAGHDLVDVLQMTILDGRAFSRDRANEGNKVILNEAAIKAMGIESPVGKSITIWGKDYEIVGVIKNFHYESLYEKVKPLFYRAGNWGDRVMVRIQPGTEVATIEKLESHYETFNNGLDFEFKFLDTKYQEIYASETRVSQLSQYFATIALIISCLGLLGLATFSAERRTKEIGIRKALGSSTVAVVKLLTAEFTRMVLVAIVIGLPLSYFIVQDWLADFAYRIELSPWFFLLFGVLALLIAWITVSFQTFRAARVRPVESLRYE